MKRGSYERLGLHHLARVCGCAIAPIILVVCLERLGWAASDGRLMPGIIVAWRPRAWPKLFVAAFRRRRSMSARAMMFCGTGGMATAKWRWRIYLNINSRAPAK